MAWVEILPRYVSLFRRLGWESADRFLSWTGVLVNQHRHRQVEQVQLPGAAHEVSGCDDGGAHEVSGGGGTPGRLLRARLFDSFFLKKEYNVTWRDRLRNAWHGFGWCATAVREGATLQALRRAGVGCPEVAALGESGRQAFVLISDESAMTELRAILPSLEDDQRRRLVAALGRELARVHDAGFDHPDLFAKHLLVSFDGAVFRFCILDWQRARWRGTVPWRVRCRDLAILDATLHAGLARDRLRWRFLRAYRRACGANDAPPLRKLAQTIRANATSLANRRHLREIAQAWVAHGDQQFVPFAGGRLLVVRSFAEECGSQAPGWMSDLCLADADARRLGQHFAYASGSEALQIHTLPSATNSREMPELAHMLFRLQRFGVAAPRLVALAYAPGRVHAVTRSPAASSLDEAIAKASPPRRREILRQAGAIVRRIHEAGYGLPAGDEWARRLGVAPGTGEIVLAKVEPLVRQENAWQEFAPVELNGQRFRLSRGERLRFLSGYLRRGAERQAA